MPRGGGEGRGAVDALHRDGAQCSLACCLGQRLDGCRQSGGAGLVLGRRRRRRIPGGTPWRIGVVCPGQQGLAAALHVQRQLAVDSTTSAPALRPGLWPAPAGDRARAGRRRRRWPGRRRRAPAACRCARPGASRRTALRPPVAGRTDRAQPVHRAVHRELRGAQALDHIAAARLAAVLERGQHAVDGGETALDPSAATAPRVTTPCRSSSVRARAWARWVASGSPVGQQRPAAGDGRRAGAGRPGARGGPVQASRNGRAGPGAWRGAPWSPRYGPSRAASAAGRACRSVSRPDQARSQSVVGELGIGGVRVRGGADLVGDLAEEQPVAARRERPGPTGAAGVSSKGCGGGSSSGAVSAR